jgi:CRISPR-associated protein Cas2
MHYLLCYDVQDDKKRDKICKMLKDVGYHSQRSVFLLPFEDAAQARATFLRVLELVSPPTDRVLMAPLCASCLSRMAESGDGPRFRQEVWLF